jgi:hypothetical protein
MFSFRKDIEDDGIWLTWQIVSNSIKTSTTCFPFQTIQDSSGYVRFNIILSDTRNDHIQITSIGQMIFQISFCGYIYHLHRQIKRKIIYSLISISILGNNYCSYIISRQNLDSASINSFLYGLRTVYNFILVVGKTNQGVQMNS